MFRFLIVCASSEISYLVDERGTVTCWHTEHDTPPFDSEQGVLLLRGYAFLFCRLDCTAKLLLIRRIIVRVFSLLLAFIFAFVLGVGPVGAKFTSDNAVGSDNDVGPLELVRIYVRLVRQQRGRYVQAH